MILSVGSAKLSDCAQSLEAPDVNKRAVKSTYDIGERRVRLNLYLLNMMAFTAFKARYKFKSEEEDEYKGKIC